MKNRLGTRSTYLEFISQSGGAQYFKGRRGRGGSIFGLIKSIFSPKTVLKALVPMAKKVAHKGVRKGAHVISELIDDKASQLIGSSQAKKSRKKVKKEKSRKKIGAKLKIGKRRSHKGGMKFTNPRSSLGMKRKKPLHNDVFSA